MSEKFYPLPERPVTVTISDLHIGGGKNDRNDDHVHHGQSFIRFLKELPGKVGASADEILLVINGDFLEFAQTAQEVFNSSIAYGHWCSEQESLDKLKVIIDGNPEIWPAMQAFQEQGGFIVIAVGNHDIDFSWPKVRDVFTATAGYGVKYVQEEDFHLCGSLLYACGKDWLSAYGGKLLITHGNQFDPANRFRHWHNPIVGYTPERLEMCPGTMFMVKFVNPVEELYPFVDNIIPITQLYSILKDNDPDNLGYLKWLLGVFIAQHPVHAFLDKTSNEDGISPDYKLERLFDAYLTDDDYRQTVDRLIGEYVKEELPPDWNQSYQAFNDVIIVLIAKIPSDRIGDLFCSDRGMLGTGRAALIDDKQLLRDKADQTLLDYNAEMVIMGHTHQPDRYPKGREYYFNPGSWTRYWNIKTQPNLTLGDLKNEENFPYELNFVEVRRDKSTGKLFGKMTVFESS